MADRYFRNEMPGFLEETEEIVEGVDSLTRLLSLPYATVSQRFLQVAVEIRDEVVKETWRKAQSRSLDVTLYTGCLGTAYLLFKSYQVTGDKKDLQLCNKIIRSCDAASQGSNHLSFICGRAGILALGAAEAKNSGDDALLNYYLRSFKEVRISERIPNELLYGRVGFLWSCSFLNKHLGGNAISSEEMAPIVQEVIKEGRRLSRKRECPLMYEWHGKKYWGAAHGLAGIMHVLMDMELKPEEQEYVKGTLNYMIKNRFQSGNYPSSEESESDRLVHWCHGAPGVALTLVKAAQVFGDDGFMRAAIDAAEVVWNRGLLKRVGICHGVSGNAYVFLSLYRLTGNVEYLYKAKAFACFLLDEASNLISEGKMHGGDHPYSLFEGIGGMAYLLFDMINPSHARFPAYEL